MLIGFLRLFESKKARNIRLARERAERFRIAREVELQILQKNARDRKDMRDAPSEWMDSIVR